jgi:hypothetical protein
MKGIRGRITYANVVGTLALFLTLSGGAVWAADKITSKQIGKGAVKTKNLAKNAVKKKNLAKNSVTSPKLAKNAVKNADVADGAVNFAKLAAGTNVVASATAGPILAGQDGPVAFSPPLSVTPVAGQPLTVSLEARGRLTASGMSPCAMIALPVINGNPMIVGELLQVTSSIPAPPPLEAGFPVGAVSFPVGLTQPGVPQNISLEALSLGTSCTPDSRIDQIAVVVTQAK